MHEVNYAATHADDIVAMKDGQAAAAPTSREVMTERTISDLFATLASTLQSADRAVVTYT